MFSRLTHHLISLVLLALVAQTCFAQAERRSNLGYFEAGSYPVHSLLRSTFYDHLEQILPEGYHFTRIPQGFRSAEWKRDQCRTMAGELAKVDEIDLMIAMGPWVVHDLLAAGFSKPILAMHQFDPQAEGLVDSRGRPIVDNLTVHIDPGRMVGDLRVLSLLVDVKRLAFLYFPSADESDLVVKKVSDIGEKLGFEVVTAEGYDIFDAYAFFKSFKNLEGSFDAIYLPPLWGLEGSQVDDFLELVSDSRVPAFTSEGKSILDKGAFATNSYYSAISEARFQATKAVRIMQGESPADLPVMFRGGPGLAVNNATALKCGINLPMDVLSDFHVIEAPPPESAPFYTINDAVNRAVTQNPGFLSFYDAAEAAAQAARQAYSELLPHLYGAAGLSYVDNNYVHNYRDLISNEQYSASLNFEQTLSMETIRSIEVATQQRRMAEMDLKQAQLDLELAVSLAYLNYLRASEILSVQVKNRSLIEHNLEMAWARNQTAGADTLDVIRLESERYQATLRVTEARSELKVARILLNRLFNMPGEAELVLDAAPFSESLFWDNEGRIYPRLKDLPSQRELQTALVARALTDHPAVGSSDLNVSIRRQLLSQNSARYYPKLGLRASLDYSDWLENEVGFEEQHTTWTISGFLRIPFLLGMDRPRERARLKAQLSEAEYLKDETGLHVMQAVQTELQGLIGATSNVTPAHQSRRQATQALEMVVVGYGSGDRTLLELLDAQSNVHRTETVAILARYNYFEAMARLVHAVGWTVHDDYSSFLEKFHERTQN